MMNKFKKGLILLVSTSALLGSYSVMADEGADLYTSKGCAACHGADASTPIMPTYPKLGGQSAEYALAQMKDIKSGARSNGLSVAMKAVVATVSDEELDAIAKYLAGL